MSLESDLAELCTRHGLIAQTSTVVVTTELPEGGLDLRDAVEQFENSMIVQALKRCRGNRAHAAKLLRMNRTTLVEKIRAHGLTGVVAE